MLKLKFSNFKFECGTDEAGRGCLAGPVTAAAVILPSSFKNSILNDSKQLSEKKRDLLKPIIESESLSYGVAHVFQTDIDKINIDKHQQMLSLKQLIHESDTTKLKFNSNLAIRSNNLRASFGGNELRPFPDSIPNQNLNPDILENFNLKQKTGVISNAIQHNKRELENLERKVSVFKRDRKILNLYDYEYHYRIAFSFACLAS